MKDFVKSFFKDAARMPCLPHTLKTLSNWNEETYSLKKPNRFSGIEDQMLKAGWDAVLKRGKGQETK